MRNKCPKHCCWLMRRNKDGAKTLSGAPEPALDYGLLQRQPVYERITGSSQISGYMHASMQGVSRLCFPQRLVTSIVHTHPNPVVLDCCC
jgi:hypothetical protein